MLITISTNPTMKIDLTEKEINILAYAYGVMENIEKMVICEDIDDVACEGIGDVVITSQKTGECFDLTELQRALGILDGIISNVGEQWDLKSKKDVPSISF